MSVTPALVTAEAVRDMRNYFSVCVIVSVTFF